MGFLSVVIILAPTNLIAHSARMQCADPVAESPHPETMNTIVTGLLLVKFCDERRVEEFSGV